MVLTGGIIQSPIIYTNPPLSDLPSGYQFIVLISNNRDATLLRDHLHRTYPFAVRDGVNNTRIKQLDYFFPHHLLHHGVKVPLRLDNGFEIFFKQNFVHTESRAYTLDVTHCPTQSLLVPS